MTTIKAPYNFVPLEDTVFFPEWQNRISQDIPFSDGVSGRIDIKIEAKTPIFVRNGQTQLTELEKKEGKKGDDSFSHTDDGRYFIPGTSIKGELRNVLEILSFGKMTQVQDARFGIRMIGNQEYHKTLLTDVHCGWLTKKANGEYAIEDCGKPLRISLEEIDNALGSNLYEDAKNLDCKSLDKKKEDERKSATYKYMSLDLLNKIQLSPNATDKELEDKAMLPEELYMNFTFDAEVYGKRIYKISQDGDTPGTIVLTGQPDRKKHYEFIFQDNVISEYTVNKDVIRDFRTIHKNNYDYKNLWHDRLEQGCEVPVFFTIYNGKVAAIGLTYMFRYPTINSIHTAIPAQLQITGYKDLAECIFGTATQNHELKGRVFISPAFLEGDVKFEDEVHTTLSSPKPSFASLYVEHGSWMNANARINGRKRYPVRSSTWENETGNGNTETRFVPLAAGAVFSGHIYFHNLRKAELGALISALTFNDHAECFHSIGEAKPLGFGKVKISIEKTEAKELKSAKSVENIDTYLKAFQDKISESVLNGKNLEDTASVKELIAMAKGIPANKNEEFKYMKMSTEHGQNEFIDAQKFYLPRFTSIMNSSGKNNNNVTAQRLSREYNSMADLEKKIQEEELKCKKDIEERLLPSMLEKMEKDADSAIDRQDYREAIAILEKANNLRESSTREEKIKRCEDCLKQQEYDRHFKAGSDFFENEKYEEALKEYETAKSFLNTDEVQGRIKECKKMMGIGVEKYLPQSLSSIPAYTGRIDKWINECGIKVISDSDKDKIIDNINSLFGSLPPKGRKEWSTKAPGRLRQYLGDDIAKLNL